MSSSSTNAARARPWCGAIAAMCAACLCGCVVGPDYRAPAPTTARGFAPEPMPALTASAPVPGGEAQRFVTGQDIRADWWALFESPALDAMVERALRANPTLEAAQAALRIAQENVEAQRGLFFPTVQAGYSPTRTKIAGNQGGNSPGLQGDGSVISTGAATPASQGGSAPFNAPVIYNFHTAQLTVGYVPDVFGGNRRQVESLEAQADYQRLQLEAAQITLASNVVAAAIQEALLRAQIATAQRIVDGGVQSVALLRRQQEAGHASRLDLALQETALSQARQTLPPLQKQFAQTRNLLRALVGGMPDVELPVSFELASLRLPRELPLSLPSQVVAQRPDVRAAEAQLQAASAQVGVAVANRLPQFSLDATWGGAASHIGQMFWSSGRFFNLAGNVTQTLFDGGALKHRQAAAEEGLRQAGAQYQSTVITAFQNVADTLRAIHADADAMSVAVELERHSGVSLALVRRQLSGGYVDRLALLTAEQVHDQAVLSLAQAQAARLGDTAALFQALGGGWWPRETTVSN